MIVWNEKSNKSCFSARPPNLPFQVNKKRVITNTYQYFEVRLYRGGITTDLLYTIFGVCANKRKSESSSRAQSIEKKEA